MPNGVRTRNLFDPASSAPYKLSRSKLEMFVRCPRCFYLDRKLGIGQVSMPAFTLNNAVDLLLKKEFDRYRAREEPHPLMRTFGVEAVPMRHPQLDDWRNNRIGVQGLDGESNMLLYGAVDDLWLNVDGETHVVDYKATSIDGTVTLDGTWKESYKRQVEVYQWLLRHNNLLVSDTAFFVYVNADKAKADFGETLVFSTVILPHDGDASWVPEALHEARICLERQTLPPSDPACEWCMYRKAAGEVESR